MDMKEICVVGLGYIGLPTSSLLATKGHDVIGVDVSKKVVETINKGEIHIQEPELDILVKSAVHSGRLRASNEPEESDIFVIAVPTPFKGGNEPDLSYIESAVRSIAPYIRAGNLIILESTSPVGTTEIISKWLSEEREDLCFPRRGAIIAPDTEMSRKQIYIAHCPERVLPGHILRELVENDRIIGGVDEKSTEKATKFYETFVSGEILKTDSRTAELAKLTENTYRDVNIALANELSLICDKLNTDVWDLIRLANHHPRVNILFPGPGVGGHCIAVDPWFIISSAPEESKLIRAARERNLDKPHYVVEKTLEKASRLKNPKVACLGLSYKPDIDDLRESPAVQIVEELASHKDISILAVEPHITELPKNMQKTLNVEYATLSAALEEADIILCLVAHKNFKNIDLKFQKEKIILDYCGLLR